MFGGTDGDVTHAPLEWLYGKFSTYIEDRRRNPKDDVLTGLAQATFPDGSVPELIEVAGIAANVFAAGQETTARLLSYALQIVGDRRDIQQRLREDRSLIPNFEECLRMERRVKDDFRLAKKPTTVGGVDVSGAPLARAETVVALKRMFDRTSDIRISEEVHGAAGERRYTYLPTLILRGLIHLNLEFDPVEVGRS